MQLFVFEILYFIFTAYMEGRLRSPIRFMLLMRAIPRTAVLE
jgi:hypothetical protein